MGSNFLIGKDIRKAGEVPTESFVAPDLPAPPALPNTIP
jgi:hypothetical protein